MGDDGSAANDARGQGKNSLGNLKLFISYSRHDLAFAESLVTALEAHQFDVLIDRRDLPALEDWQRELLGFIRQADTVVFVTSRHSLASNVCAWEVEQVRALSKRLAPVVIEDIAGLEMPAEIARINFLFFTGEQSQGTGFQAQVDALASALLTDVDWIKEHTRLGQIARRWSERGFPSAQLLRGREIVEAQTWIASQPRSAPEPTELHRTLIAASQASARRRQRLIIAASVCVSLFTTTLAGFAYYQRNQRTLLLSKTVHVATEIVASAAAIKDQIGVPSKTILTLLEIPDRSLAAIADQTADIPDVIRAFARLDYDICLMSIQAGEFTKGVQRCERGVKRMAALGKIEQPTAPDLEHLERLLRMAAAGSQEGGDPKAAERFRRQREQIARNLPDVNTERLDRILQDVRGLADRAYADLASRDKLPLALASLEKAYGMLAGAIDSDPTNGTLELEMSLVENRLVEVLLSLDRLDDALPYAKDSTKRMMRLKTSQPDDIEVMRHQAHALDGLARAGLRTKDVEVARTAITELGELTAKLATLDPARVDIVSLRPVADMRKGALARLVGRDDAFRPLLAAHAQFVSINKKANQASIRLLLLENANDILDDPKVPSAEAFAVLQDGLEVELAAIADGVYARDVVDGLRTSAAALYHRFKENRVRKEIVAAAIAVSKTPACASSGDISQSDACLSVADIVRNQVGNDEARGLYKKVLGAVGKSQAGASPSATVLLVKGLASERLCQLGLEAILAGKTVGEPIEPYCEGSAVTAHELNAIEPAPIRLEEEATRYNKGALACLFQDKVACALDNFKKGWSATMRLLQQDANYDSPAVEQLLRAGSAPCGIKAKSGKVDFDANLRVLSDMQQILLRRTIDKLAREALSEASKACKIK